MIYDCFTYFGGHNEEALLKMRVDELYPLDVVHVAVEADHTFTGKPKPFTLPSFDAPIKHIKVTDMPNNGNPWDNETHQRNAIMRGLEFANYNDIIIISDLDEIPRASSVSQYRFDFGTCALVMDQMQYYLNVLSSRQSWRSTKILPYSFLKMVSPEHIRCSGQAMGLLDAGFHFSYLGGVDTILKKMEAFSHQEEETQALADRGNIQQKIINLESLVEGKKMSVISTDELPKYANNLKHLLI